MSETQAVVPDSPQVKTPAGLTLAPMAHLMFELSQAWLGHNTITKREMPISKKLGRRGSLTVESTGVKWSCKMEVWA